MAVQPDATTALHAVRDLRARLQDALVDGHPPEGCEVGARLVADLVELHELALWARDAGLAYARLGDTCGWARLANESGVPLQTLQSRWKKWYEREAESA